MNDDDETRIERDGPPPTDDDGQAEMVVPWERLSASALRGVIEEFVTREGTEYGAHDIALDAKVAQIQRQLERGEVVVLFDAKAQTVNLARATELRGRG